MSSLLDLVHFARGSYSRFIFLRSGVFRFGTVVLRFRRDVIR